MYSPQKVLVSFLFYIYTSVRGEYQLYSPVIVQSQCSIAAAYRIKSSTVVYRLK